MSQPDELKHAGLKATLPRLKILDLFQKGPQRHFTADDIYRLLLQERMEIGLATVYRVVAQLEQARLLKRSSFQSEKAVYELDDGRHHDHLVCLDCGKVDEFHDEAIEKRQALVAHELGFRLQEHALALYGVCTKAACPNRPEHRHVGTAGVLIS
ncbi:ferric iron uptake transcriptional regulator [Variovorax sp. GB1P17]|uniref:ferric iron uptake transcriptional regulator n=1 Tax=Variovorax sp. GB1P17 TaxID=3443740 RepID=UPI003F459A91